MPDAKAIPSGFTLPETLVKDFEVKPALLSLVERNMFSGLPKEDPHKHIRIFCDYCSTVKHAGITQSQLRMILFPFSLDGDARDWITDLDKETLGINTWDKLALAFYQKYYPTEKTSRLRTQITSFEQTSQESLTDAWERFKKLIRECPHHGLEKWFLVVTFYNGLFEESRDVLDSAANGRFMNNTKDDKAWDLIEEMSVHNQQYGKPRGNSKTAHINKVDSRFDVAVLSAQISDVAAK